MNLFPPRTVVIGGALAAAVLTLSACGAAPETTTSGDGVNAAKATSAEDFGGMDQLIAAAKREGKLNAIALPRDWPTTAR